MWPKKSKSPVLRKEKKVTTPRKQLILRILSGVLTILFLAGLIYSVWYITRLSVFTINSIEVIGGDTIGHARIEELVNIELSGTYYRLVPKRFTFLYPQESIESAVARIPRVESVVLEKDGMKKIIVAFSEYAPFALWCDTIEDLECLFVDRSGFAFAPAPRLEGRAYLRFIVSGEAAEIGKNVMDAGYIRGATAFTETVYKELSLHITSLQISENEITYFLAGGGELRTSLDISFENTLQNIKTILDSEQFNHLEPGNFEYIDLRYGDKVFVHEGLEEVASSTEDVVIEEEL